jgi:hypothetical protein
MGSMGALGKENAPTSKRMPPSTINTRPGQFSFSPNPAPGLRGSRVSRGTAEDPRRLASLSRPRQMGWATMNSSPPRTNSAPSQILISHRLVIGKLPQNTLIRLVVHTSRLDRLGAARLLFEPSAQFLDMTRRAVPSVAHRRLIGNASAFVAAEKRDAVIVKFVLSIENARRTVAFAAKKYEVSPAKMSFPPVAGNDLPYRVQRFASRGPNRKFQYQSLCIRPAGYLKPDRSEQ